MGTTWVYYSQRRFRKVSSTKLNEKIDVICVKILDLEWYNFRTTWGINQMVHSLGNSSLLLASVNVWVFFFYFFYLLVVFLCRSVLVFIFHFILCLCPKALFMYYLMYLCCVLLSLSSCLAISFTGTGIFTFFCCLAHSRCQVGAQEILLGK